MNASRTFWQVLKTDILKILRDRVTLALIIFQAIVTMVLIGVTFNEGIRDIPIVVVQKYNDPVSNEVVSAITSSDQFQVVAYVGSEGEAKSYINKGLAQGAVVVDTDLTAALVNGSPARVKILVDGSNPMVQYTFRALGTNLTNAVQQQIYKKIIEGIRKTLKEVESSGASYSALEGLTEEAAMDGSRYFGYYQLASTGVSETAGAPQILQNALQNYYVVSSAINGKTAAMGATLTEIGKNVGSVVNGYDETANVIEPIGNYLVQKGTDTGDVNLISTGYKLIYLADTLRSAAGRFRSAGVDTTLKVTGERISSAQLPFASPHPALGASASIPTAPTISRKEIVELIHSIQQALKQFELKVKNVSGDFSVKYDVLYNGDKLRILDLIAPTLIALFVAMGTLATTAPMVVRERTKGILERISTTPIPPVLYILSKILAALAVTTVQVVVLILVGVFFFRIYIGGGVWALLFILFPVALSHIGMGILISTHAKTEREAVQAIPAILVPSIILSGIIIPISMLPSYIRPVAYLLPLTYCQDALIGVMVKGGALATYLSDIVALFAFAAVFLAGGVIAFVKSTRS